MKICHKSQGSLASARGVADVDQGRAPGFGAEIHAYGPSVARVVQRKPATRTGPTGAAPMGSSSRITSCTGDWATRCAAHRRSAAVTASNPANHREPYQPHLLQS